VQVKINPGAFKGLSSDVEFASLLAEEESVLVLPGNNLLMISLMTMHLDFVGTYARGII
jgi:hypothetical protein